MTLAFIADLLALIEDVNLLSVLAGTLATAAFVIVLTTREIASWPRVLFEATTIPLRGPFRFFADLIRASICPQTLPPVEAHITQFPAVRLLSTAYRESPDRNFLSCPGNWRAWGFRTWRLERYFANTPVKPLNPSDNDKG
jgi:hypothetical protein